VFSLSVVAAGAAVLAAGGGVPLKAAVLALYSI